MGPLDDWLAEFPASKLESTTAELEERIAEWRNVLALMDPPLSLRTEILHVLGDGEPHSWTELHERIDCRPQRLSNKLAEMREGKEVRRISRGRYRLSLPESAALVA